MADVDELPPPYQQDVALPPPPRQMGLFDQIDERDDEARSMPALQFQYQIELEKQRILRHFRPGGKLMKSLPMDPECGINAHALHNIRARWTEWGIWDDNWEVTGRFGHWMHEDLNTRGKEQHRSSKERPLPQGRAPFDPSLRFIEKPVDKDALNRSRPLNQFWSQVAHEREYLEETGLFDPARSTQTIDEQARENVRHRWERQKIWLEQWSDIPGHSWKHEILGLGDHAQWFYKAERFNCQDVPELDWTLPSNPSMWFRKEPNVASYGNLNTLPKKCVIVPCNCMPIGRRNALKKHPITPIAKSGGATDQHASTRISFPEQQQAGTALATNEAMDADMDEAPDLEIAPPKSARKSRGRQPYNNGEPRRSLRIKEKQEQVVKKPVANRSVAKKQRTGKKIREKKQNVGKNTTTPKKSRQKRQRRRR